jgi:hypothetical protein
MVLILFLERAYSKDTDVGDLLPPLLAADFIEED